MTADLNFVVLPACALSTFVYMNEGRKKELVRAKIWSSMGLLHQILVLNWPLLGILSLVN